MEIDAAADHLLEPEAGMVAEALAVAEMVAMVADVRAAGVAMGGTVADVQAVAGMAVTVAGAQVVVVMVETDAVAQAGLGAEAAPDVGSDGLAVAEEELAAELGGAVGLQSDVPPMGVGAGVADPANPSIVMRQNGITRVKSEHAHVIAASEPTP